MIADAVRISVRREDTCRQRLLVKSKLLLMSLDYCSLVQTKLNNARDY